MAVTVAGAAVVYRFDPAITPGFPHCRFLELTGFLCAGCGTLRALHAFLHGRVLEGLRCNLLLPFIAAALIIAVARAHLPRDRWFWLGAAAVIAFTVLRNLPPLRAISSV